MRNRIGSWWRGLSTRGKAIVVGGVVVVVLAIGALGGQPAEPTSSATPSGVVAGTSPPPTSAVSASPTVESTPPAASALASPVTSPSGNSVAQFGAQIPGLTAADVTLDLEELGFTCGEPTTFLDGIDYICDYDVDPTYAYRVEIVGMNPSDIRSVEAVHFWFGEASEADADADEFLGHIATLPYEGAMPDEATAWVQANDSGTETFGPATFELTTAETGLARTLEISGTQ